MIPFAARPITAMEALNYTLEDLDLNRAGKISGRQLRRLIMYRLEAILLFGILPLFVTGFVVCSVFYDTDSKINIMRVIWIPYLLWGIWTMLPLLPDIVLRRAASASGPVELSITQ